MKALGKKNENEIIRALETITTFNIVTGLNIYKIINRRDTFLQNKLS